MAVIPREELSFARIVEQYFLALKGRGVMVSATDLARIRGWEQSGVPVRLVCEAIQEAYERRKASRGPEARPPASLAFCSRSVQRAIRAWQQGRVGGGR